MKKVLLTTAAMALVASSSYGAGIIRFGDTYLGVNDQGHLNTPTYNGVTTNSSHTGLTYGGTVGTRPAGNDATSPGCLCEGWGVSASGVSGYANVSVGGVSNLTVDSFTSDAVDGSVVGTYATSAVHLTGTPGISVTQAYAASAASGVFQNTVTIKNTTGAAITDVRYVRVMDWDVPPTEFSEFVTIKGTATTTQLELSHDDGFEVPDPLAATGELTAGTTDVDFTDVGASDHGAYFKFNFGSLADGESKTFSIFYGAAANEAGALSALATIGAELYSLGQSTNRAGGPANDEATFIFAFKGVGGVVIETPDGGQTLGLLGASMGLLGLVKRRLSRRA